MHLIPGQSFFHPSVPEKDMNLTKKHTVNYDFGTDVLYVTFGTGESNYCEEVDDFLLLERGMFTKKIIGYRLIGFKEKMRSRISPEKDETEKK